MTRTQEVLEGREGSYILPFFWQHHEEERILRDYVRAICESGIREMCLECRPHPDFLGPDWWEDMDIIMEEARSRGMGVWLLDDAHFPTGYANGAIEAADPSLCKEYINMVTADVRGPMPRVTLDVAGEIRRRSARQEPDPMAAYGMGSRCGQRHFDTDRLLRVLAYRAEAGGRIGPCIDLTERVRDGVLVFDVPAGFWRIYMVYYTQNGGGRTDYMNIISGRSVRQLIDAVYEPVYARYAADFGGTFRGFFSDEPVCGNFINNYEDRSLIGTRHMPLPWCDALEERLRGTMPGELFEKLPLLWDAGVSAQETADCRFAYMDAFTSLVRENFSDRLGAWCRERGVSYIGHLVEDSNRSASVNYLGCWARAMHGQDMAGIDCIGGGVLPAGEDRLPEGSDQENGGFYHFTLGKLAASLAMLDPKKEGRSLVECFGAYGWSLGVRGMKYIADHFLVRGINHFTPHAFSPKPFPDPDCPPHFYAGGENVQFSGFGKLMRYTQRVCHLTNGGRIHAPAAILHSDMSAWCGGVTYPEETAKALAGRQVEYLFVFEDWLGEAVFVREEKTRMRIGRACFDMLVIPGYEVIVPAALSWLERAKEEGFPVFYVGRRPVRAAGLPDAEIPEFPVLSLPEAAERAVLLCGREIETEEPFPGLRCLHYQGDTERYFFVNEALGETYRGRARIRPENREAVPFGYDAMENALFSIPFVREGDALVMDLEVRPWESLFILLEEKDSPAALRAGERPCLLRGEGEARVRKELRDFGVSVSGNPSREPYRFLMRMETPENVGRYAPDFSGVIRYEKEIVLDDGDWSEASFVLSLEDAYEDVRVFAGGAFAGERIAPPYRFDLTGLIGPGKNTLCIEVATTMDRRVRSMEKEENPFMRPSPVLAPTGLVGRAELLVY